MAISWTEALAVGVPEIDNQHKELFNRIDALLEASGKGRGREEVASTISFLESYVVTHFRSEEGLMAKFNYPNITQHKQLHADFVKEFGALKAQFERDGVNSLLVIAVQKKVVEWLKIHIGRDDKAVGNFIQTKR